MRQPASADLTCSESVKGFFVESKISFTSSERALLSEKTVAEFLSKQKSERAEIEKSLMLIKKKYQHMDSTQVIGHFKLLRNACERS